MILPVLTRSEARLDLALRQCVTDGRVNYTALAASGAVAERNADLARVDTGKMGSREQQLTFWINTYNTLVLAGGLEQMRAGRADSDLAGSALGRIRFFALRHHTVGAMQVSLAHIEKRILRGGLCETRALFALCRGAVSSPPLRAGVYFAETLNVDLDEAARAFVRSPRGMVVDRESHQVFLSQIFGWHRRDFESAVSGTVLDYVEQYADEDMRAYLARHGVAARVRYLRWDWRLNDTGG